jgi:signal transduction histidine kinase
MLGFSRDSDQQSGTVDLNTVVDDTLKLLGDRFLREIEVKFEPAPDLPQVCYAKDFIQQILLNFIFNAAESLAERKVIILSTRLLQTPPAGMVLTPSRPGPAVSVSVKDFGCGISAEILPRIFEPFFTTKAFSARRGTGLGLSMVYELARKMNAGLAVDTLEKEGSSFTLILPLGQDERPGTNPL